MSKKIELRIHRVSCIDETGGKYREKIGNDEIYLGGFTVNDKGETINIPPFSVYPHFDDGDVKLYNPPKVFQTYQLPAASTWPKEGISVAAGFVLIERDAGNDMSTVITKITELVKKTVAEKIEEEKRKRKEEEEKRKNQSLNVNMPLFIGLLALKPILIAVLTNYGPEILDFIKRNLIRGLRDEVFQPQVVSVEIPKPDFTWAGSKDSAENTVHFTGYSGHYTLTYDWQLID